MYCVLEKYHIYMVVWDVMDYSELFYMYCVLDVYWNYSIVDELNVSLVVLRNSAANAAVAAIAAIFFKTVANCVEYTLIRRNYRPKIASNLMSTQNDVTVCPVIASNKNLDAKLTCFF